MCNYNTQFLFDECFLKVFFFKFITIKYHWTCGKRKKSDALLLRGPSGKRNIEKIKDVAVLILFYV